MVQRRISFWSLADVMARWHTSVCGMAYECLHRFMEEHAGFFAIEEKLQ